MTDTTMKTVLKDARDGVARPLGEAVSLPAALYTDPAIFELERRAVFLTGWLFAGRLDQVAKPGAYRSVETPGGPVLVVRGDDDIVRAFANICRHRSSILLEGEGTCRRIVCPYHAWSYLLDGRLLGAPGMSEIEGFNPDEHGLLPIRLETWAGFMFITFDDDAPALRERLGDMPDRMASHRLEEMRQTWNLDLDCACNWKLLLENAVEAYHTGLVHRATVGAQESRSIDTNGDWVCLQVLSGRSIATLPGAPPTFSAIEGLDDDARTGTYFTIAMPSCQFVVAQDCLWWLNVRPVSVDRSVLEIGGCFPEATTQLPDFDDRAEPYYERWAAVSREDVGILERQQRALVSVRHRRGPLGPREEQVRAFDAWIVERLLGAPDA